VPLDWAGEGVREFIVDHDIIKRIARNGPYNVKWSKYGPLNITTEDATRGWYKIEAQCIEHLLNQIWREAKEENNA
jgi:hypothetical protein